METVIERNTTGFTAKFTSAVFSRGTIGVDLLLERCRRWQQKVSKKEKGWREGKVV